MSSNLAILTHLLMLWHRLCYDGITQEISLGSSDQRLLVLMVNQENKGDVNMKWETPAYSELRFGFEVTMYIYNR